MTHTQSESEVKIGMDAPAKVILHNDEVNSFDHVIKTLVDICRHNPMQAEQCAMLVHHKGRYAVKEGPYEVMLAISDAMSLRKLSTTVEVA